ncbi:hypothetical protein H4696_001122 [Amycolatopsis lexingtonensis]|uniref:V-type ATPase subunit n=1 Tax=Amycolatopsis lexingtonensis TaxID=218822 RepID=A0ABR9HSX0_9PSEU|nr:hypothetical protein [Amycolatopsis lexingtonensis]MBE1494022.1 hypothetical protein [Amycolatopsis lexingtonensis]
MTAEWVAGTVRARALLNRRLGTAALRELAVAPSLAEALPAVADSPYHRYVRTGQTLAQAQRGIADGLLWQLRVLAGWQPRAGAEAVRLLAGWFEADNIAQHARLLAGFERPEPYRLGGLTSGWLRFASTTSPAELRTALARSAWGDPGADAPSAIATGVQLSWARRVAAGVPEAAAWASGGAAVLVARTRFLHGRRLTDEAAARAADVLGHAAVEAADFTGFAERLPAAARWSLAEVTGTGDLWRAEARWWTRVERDGFALLGRPGFGVDPVLGTIAVLAADAWRGRAALELAARGGLGMAVLDALV